MGPKYETLEKLFLIHLYFAKCLTPETLQHSAEQFERLLKEMCADEDGDLLIESAVKGIPKVFVVSTLVSVVPAQPFLFRNYQVSFSYFHCPVVCLYKYFRILMPCALQIAYMLGLSISCIDNFDSLFIKIFHYNSVMVYCSCTQRKCKPPLDFLFPFRTSLVNSLPRV